MARNQHIIFTIILMGVLAIVNGSVQFGFVQLVSGEEKENSPTAQETAKRQFFENKIRPLLVKHCVSCHNSKKHEGDVRMDRHSFLLKGNENGPAVVPGQPNKSRMIDVIQYSDEDSQMPPKEKLKKEEIALLTEWVKMGAPWSFDKKGISNHADLGTETFDFAEARKAHWAFRSVKKIQPPNIIHSELVKNPIDQFILVKLEAKDITLSPKADKRTLIRRVTFDLIGLPPSYAEVEEFVYDESPHAYTKLVERLLASPQYGERWGRHWLDVARYADTKGYVFQEDINYPYAYTYRDYVIRAFNEDLPYDQFITEQLAADLMDRKGDDRKLAALGFLTVGDRFSRNNNEVINDRIDLVSRGLLGLTAACARCHDHKSDPIPTADYYSMYGLFASCEEPLDLPLVSIPKQTPQYLAYQKHLDKLNSEYSKQFDKYREVLQKESRAKVTHYLKLTVHANDKSLASQQQTKIESNRFILGRWIRFIRRHTNSKDPVFTIWHQFNRLNKKKFASEANSFIARNFDSAKRPKGKAPLNKIVMQAFIKSPPKTMLDVAATYGKLLTGINHRWLEHLKTKKALESQLTGDTAQLWQVLYGENMPSTFLSSEIDVRNFKRSRKDHLRKLKKVVDTFQRTSLNAPPRAMVLIDKKQPINPRIFIRGSQSRPGKNVPRRFFQLLSDSKNNTFKNGSGRLELAQAIVDKQNPLTSRVFVNRVWMHHFGKGLVQTSSDFGIQGATPSHPELLEYLAHYLMEQGWSVKQLHRHILHSAVYQQSSLDNERGSKVDPANELLWKKPVRRLEFEAMRDSILFATGVLDLTLFGRPFNLEKRPFKTRRTIYGKINRLNLPSLLQNFDFASPDASSAKRPNTTVPQQALFSMNNIFMIEMSKKLSRHPDLLQAKTEQEKIRAIYRRLFSRNPDQNEIELGRQYLARQKKEYQKKEAVKPQKDKPNLLNPWEQYAQILLMTNEFMFVD